MFHSILIHDNYIYVAGGVNFDSENKLQVLNDIWRFDTIDCKWKCYHELGNSLTPPRFDHLLTYFSSLDFIGKPDSNGILMVGGCDGKTAGEGRKAFVFNLQDQSMQYLDNSMMSEFVYNPNEVTNNPQEKPMSLRYSADAICTTRSEAHSQLQMVAFNKSLNKENFGPLVIINKDLKGMRIPKGGRSETATPNIQFPTMGKFGQNFILMGFEDNQSKISAYVYNYPSSTWTKLQISCLHKIYTHKLTKSFVWTSHHKIIFLGSQSSKTTSGTVQYFDTIVLLSLPFTNIFGIDIDQRDHFKSSSSSITTVPKPKSTNLYSSSNFNSNSFLFDYLDDKIDDNDDIIDKRDEKQLQSSLNVYPYNQISSPMQVPAQFQTVSSTTGGFAEYSQHVAQKVEVNSIRSVLPSAAIAIGKSAFDRNDAFSDLELVCLDGSSVKTEVTICRRRWGPAFDILLTDAYAKVIADESFNSWIKSESGSSIAFDSSLYLRNMRDDADSIRSKSSETVPHFRYPFKDKESSRDTSNSNVTSRKNSISAIPPTSSSMSMSASASAPAPTSASLLTSTISPTPASTSNLNITPSLASNPSLTSANPAAERASLSISQSRRNSYVPPTPTRSRQNSLVIPGPGSRRSSFSNVTQSRRNSLNLLQQYQMSQSRRGSILSRGSFQSGGSTGTNLSSSMSRSQVLQPQPQQQQQQQQSSLSLSSAQGPLYSHSSPVKPIHPDAGGGIVYVNHLPEPMPMPIFAPDGSTPIEEALNDLENNPSNSNVNLNYSDTTNFTPTKNNTFETITGETNNFPGTPISSDFPPKKSMDDLFSHKLKSESFVWESSINCQRIPRALFLPFSKPTVRAIVEYLHSGQIGSNWKLYPTGIELMLASKRLGIPLLYDLMLEILFFVLGLLESSIKNEIIELSNNLNDNISLCDHKGKNDYELFYELLVEATQEIRRESNSTLDSNFAEILTNSTNHSHNNSNENFSNHLVDNDLGPKDLIPPISPKFRASTDIENFENNEDFNFDYDKNEFKLSSTTALLDANGFDTTDSDTDEDDELFGGRFKSFTLDSNKNLLNSNFNAPLPEGKSRHQWPTIKELINGDVKKLICRTLIDLFVELGVLINDTHLLVRAIHIRDLYLKLTDLKVKFNGLSAFNDSSAVKPDVELFGTSPKSMTSLPLRKSQSQEINSNSNLNSNEPLKSFGMEKAHTTSATLAGSEKLYSHSPPQPQPHPPYHSHSYSYSHLHMHSLSPIASVHSDHSNSEHSSVGMSSTNNSISHGKSFKGLFKSKKKNSSGSEQKNKSGLHVVSSESSVKTFKPESKLEHSVTEKKKKGLLSKLRH